MKQAPMKVVVTGGGGFLGRSILRLLLERGEEVTSVSRGDYPDLRALGARTVRADLADREATLAALEGAQRVFHVAALAGVFGPRRAFESANVTATENVIAACRAHGIRELVFTSSPSVCFDGKDHLEAGSELPQASRFLAHYPRTKAAAERAVLAASGADLATVALRPHLIVGPGDPHLLPRLIERARSGRLRIVGSGKNRVSLTHVENAARAHLAAADHLERVAGRAFFIANREPVRLWEWIGEVLTALGEPAPTRRIPLGLAYALGGALEGLWKGLRLDGEPPMTRFVALQLARSHTFRMDEFQDLTGYRERYDTAQTTRAVVEAFRSAGQGVG